MLSGEELEEAAKDFISEYLREIRFLASSVPAELLGFLPTHWVKPQQVVITISSAGGFSIEAKYNIKKHASSFRIVKTNKSIVEAIFPNLDYSGPGMLEIGAQNVTILNLSLVTNGRTPFLRLSNGAYVHLISVDFDSNPKIQGYFPMKKELIWIFKEPSIALLSRDRARSKAALEYGNQVSFLILSKMSEITGMTLEADSLEFMLSLANKLLQEYDKLIAREDLREQDLQAFLNKHYFLISTKERASLEKRSLGPFIPDFILKYDDGERSMVEIKLNNDKIFLGDSPTQALRDACRETKERFEWLKANEPKLVSQTEGIILIGRREQYQRNKEKVDALIKSLGYTVRILTYDDLKPKLENLVTLVQNSILKRKQ